MIIGIAGPTASGKTSVATLLEREHSAYRTRYSEILAAHAKATGRATDKATLQEMFLEGREKHGEDYLANLMKSRLEPVEANLIVIEGNRRLVDLDLLASLAEERGEELKLIYVDAAPEIRFERYNQRETSLGRTPISWEEFMKLEQNEAEAELPRLREEIGKVGLVLDTDNLTEETACEQALIFLGL